MKSSRREHVKEAWGEDSQSNKGLPITPLANLKVVGPTSWSDSDEEDINRDESNPQPFSEKYSEDINPCPAAPKMGQGSRKVIKNR